MSNVWRAGKGYRLYTFRMADLLVSSRCFFQDFDEFAVVFADGLAVGVLDEFELAAEEAVLCGNRHVINLALCVVMLNAAFW